MSGFDFDANDEASKVHQEKGKVLGPMLGEIVFIVKATADSGQEGKLQQMLDACKAIDNGKTVTIDGNTDEEDETDHHKVVPLHNFDGSPSGSGVSHKEAQEKGYQPITEDGKVVAYKVPTPPPGLPTPAVDPDEVLINLLDAKGKPDGQIKVKDAKADATIKVEYDAGGTAISAKRLKNGLFG